eukprot:5578073-Amphidinium_carterae.1
MCSNFVLLYLGLVWYLLRGKELDRAAGQLEAVDKMATCAHEERAQLQVEVKLKEAPFGQNALQCTLMSKLISSSHLNTEVFLANILHTLWGVRVLLSSFLQSGKLSVKVKG